MTRNGLIATTVLVGAVASLGGVGIWRPQRLAAGESDTVTVNARRPVWLNVRSVSLFGHQRPPSALRYRWVGGDSLTVSIDGQITCAHRGMASVAVEGGSLAHTIIVACMPFASFAPSQGVHLVVGTEPVDLPLTALDVDGRPIRLLHARATIGNDTVASLEGLRVRPRAPGVTWVDVDVGECVHTIEVAVDAIVRDVALLDQPYRRLDTAVRLNGGRSENWKLSAGRYELWLRRDFRADTALALDVAGAKCASLFGSLQRLECIYGDTLIVSARVMRGYVGVAAGQLTIRHLSDSTVARRAALTRIERRLSTHTVDCAESGTSRLLPAFRDPS